MEIVDELMTPGCPQCAIKHLSAALYYKAEDYSRSRHFEQPDPVPSDNRVLLARAYINLGEVLIGYKSHLWFATGLLQASEEGALLTDDTQSAAVARTARLTLEESGPDGARDAMKCIRSMTLFTPIEMEFAHAAEARRELPSDNGDYLDYERAIERIRNEFFVSDGAPAASTEDAEKGGESDMAKKTAKKAPAFLKKEDPKAKQAACKGGKSKGKKCK